MYQLTLDPNVVIRLADGTQINLPAAEREGFRYQRWLEEPNVPLPAETPPHTALVARVRAEALPLRHLALDVLSGLGFDCLAAGDASGANLCRAARMRVKDMGALDLSGFSDYESMRQAYRVEWAEISATFASQPELRTQFNKALK